MDLVQTVKIKLSDGSVGVFYGNPLVDDPKTTELQVVDVEFEVPRFVAGIVARPAGS